jgi:septal ring factor EnvC (AmiA/AmiB activator)
MSDLEKLNAEIERLEEQVADLDNRLSRYALDDWRMKEKIKSLTKAGDELYMYISNYINNNRVSGSRYLHKLCDAWQTAKKGEDAQ